MARCAALLAAVVLVLAGCGGAAEPVETGPIEITVSQGTITPSGQRVPVAIGEPVQLVVTADEPGELHVHSDPEQTLPYQAGTSTLEVVLDRPGVVPVESHDPEQIIVSLQVS